MKKIFALLLVSSFGYCGGFDAPISGGGGSSSLETMANTVRITSPTATQNFKGTSNGIGINAFATGSTSTLTFSMLPGNTNYLQSPATGTWVNTSHGVSFSTITASSTTLITGAMPSSLVNGMLNIQNTNSGAGTWYTGTNLISGPTGSPAWFWGLKTGFSPAGFTLIDTAGSQVSLFGTTGSVFNSSLTVTGAGLRVAGNIVTSSITVSSNTYLSNGNTFYHLAAPQFANGLILPNLTSGECVQTTTGGRLTTTGSACGAGGGGSLSVATKTANYTMLTTDGVILGDAASGSFTLTLPTAVGNTGKTFYVKKIDSSANTVTVDADGSETIDGSSGQIFEYQNTAITLISDGANWQIF